MAINGVARGGRGGAPFGGGRQNPAKDFFLIYILRIFFKSERIQSKCHLILDFSAPSNHNLTKLVTIFLYIGAPSPGY